jgi:DNA-binding beta-propeller fold protein YncE
MRIAGRLGVVAASLIVAVLYGSASAFAAAEPHPKLGSFGSFSNPNGIAVDEATGDVYVADIGTNTVYKFDANGTPADFSALGSNALTGIPAQSGNPAESFSFPEAPDNPAAIAVDNSKSSTDPSIGDLYVMDAGKGAIDKFSASGEFLHQITGFVPAGAGVRELLGLGVDANGTVHVDLSTGESEAYTIDEFDGSTANNPIAAQMDKHARIGGGGVPSVSSLQVHGFAVGPTGDDYQIYEGCSCTVKFGQQLSPLGRIDATGAGDVATAVDPVTGHVYIDDQSSVTEWDTGAMNRDSVGVVNPEAAGTLVARSGAPFLAASFGQGGIAVNGSMGQIYVSNPFEKDVLIFGSDTPVVTLGAPNGVTQTAAVLHGSVDSGGVPVSECKFEYAVTDEYGRVSEHAGRLEHEAPCDAATVGAVEARLEHLQVGELYRYRLVVGNANGSTQSGGLVATLGEGFGIKNFEQSFLNENGEPDTQAGSHPATLVNEFTLKSHFERVESNADSPYIRQPNGVLKDVVVDFPPGVVGDPSAILKRCTLQELAEEKAIKKNTRCPVESQIGELLTTWSENQPFLTHEESPLFDMVPPRGVAVQLATNFVLPLVFVNNGVRAGGDYPIEATVVDAAPAAPVIKSRVTVKGVIGTGVTRKAFLTLPTGCHGPLRSVIHIDSWQEPGNFKSKEYVSGNAAGTQVPLTGCSKLLFPPEMSVAPDSSDASTSSGLTVHVKVPQTAAFNPAGLAESALRDTTVTLPEGLAINPSGGDGLEACTSDPGSLPAGNEEDEVLEEHTLGTPGDQIGFKGLKAINKGEPGVPWATFSSEKPNPLEPGVNFCPDRSKIATVKVKTPLLEHELEGSMYLAAQNANPFGSLIAMYLVAEDPYSGSLVKVAGEVHLTATGQIVATFKNFPDLPFEDAEIHFFGGERAPLATPSRCGTYTAKAVFTPWDGNGPVVAESSFVIDHGPGGGPCPGAKLPFSPTFTGGSTNIQAGAFTPLTGAFSREDGEQKIARLRFTLPPGLSGVLTGVKLCDEADANAGRCGAESLIGETTVAAGVGSDPITVSGGKVYLTGPYKGAPFGLSVVEPVKSGPFDLEHDTSNPGQDPACDCVVVRAKVEIDPLTTALTITSNSEAEGFAIPHLIDGVSVELKKINFATTRSGFQFNPTNCEKMAIAGVAESDEGQSHTVEVPFQVTNCARLAFKPNFKVSVSGRTSRVRGAGLHVRLTYPKTSWGTQANIRSVKVNLPRQLPSRLTTLQKACAIKVFNANPAACPAASRVGRGKAVTPILPVPLQGPAYFVSHGGAKFPELIIVLQGYGIRIDLHGETFINEKTNITSSTYHAVPDQPVTSFELTLPQGPNSALAANGNLCKPTKTVLVKRRVHGHTRRVRKRVAARLAMPTAFTAQNGATIHQNTPIAITGCSHRKSTRSTATKR